VPVPEAIGALAAPVMEAQAKPIRLPSLDGWRALSILMVLGAHTTHTTGFPEELRPLFLWVFDGALGVRFFFCISGFLITYLMLQEAERTGRMSLRDFYVRRTLRILPVYFLYLAVLLGLQCTTPLKLTAGEWAASLTFTADFASGQWLNGHLWSLAVEEQFYLLWRADWRPAGGWRCWCWPCRSCSRRCCGSPVICNGFPPHGNGW